MSVKKVQSLNKHLKGAMLALFGAMTMFGLAFASVPLYRAFCDITGFNGTPIKSTEAKNTNTGVELKLRFDSNVNGLNWVFTPETPIVTVEVGKTSIAYFSVTNRSDKAVTGRATYNVLPMEIGGHFMKLECFCFTDQTLKPGETKSFPMVFFIDPEMLKDVDTRSVREVTLSYTFFPSVSEAT
jgi:cytochrome c oxidase assembly protein subunit 11